MPEHGKTQGSDPPERILWEGKASKAQRATIAISIFAILALFALVVLFFLVRPEDFTRPRFYRLSPGWILYGSPALLAFVAYLWNRAVTRYQLSDRSVSVFRGRVRPRRVRHLVLHRVERIRIERGELGSGTVLVYGHQSKTPVAWTEVDDPRDVAARIRAAAEAAGAKLAPDSA